MRSMRLFLLICLFANVGCEDSSTRYGSYNFRVTLTNVSTDGHVAPGIYLVGENDNPLFTLGQADRGIGLESLAEDGDPLPLARALNTMIAQTGAITNIFNLDSEHYRDGAIGPGEAFVFEITAKRGEALHLASMLGISNDSFYATDSDGIELFSGSRPLTLIERVTDIQLYDLGTEINEPLGQGQHQPAQQAMPNMGTDEGGVIHQGDEAYPQYDELMSITIELIGGNE